MSRSSDGKARITIKDAEVTVYDTEYDDDPRFEEEELTMLPPK